MTAAQEAAQQIASPGGAAALTAGASHGTVSEQENQDEGDCRMWQLASIFAAVFLAELGDKTQLATLLFASQGRHHPVAVFAAAALALCVSTGLAVFLGSIFAERLQGVPLKLLAGIGFLAIGTWTIVDHLRG